VSNALKLAARQSTTEEQRMTNFTEREIKGAWQQGYALDVQTISSVFLGYSETGRARFDTKRSEVGELLYKLKYRADKSAVDPLANAAVTLLLRWKPSVDLVVPVPASSVRTVPPVLLVAQAIAKIGNKPCIECVQTTRKPAQQLKNVYDPEERKKLLDGLFTVDPLLTNGKNILLVDDLYRSGATMNAITETLLGQGQAASVVVLSLTCTRSNT
jgi:competence protein ComFC